MTKVLMKNGRKLSSNYHQILSHTHLICSSVYYTYHQSLDSLKDGPFSPACPPIEENIFRVKPVLSDPPFR